MKIYSIFDDVLNEHFDLFIASSNIQALQIFNGFKTAFKASDSAHFKLFALADFDVVSANFKVYDEPIEIRRSIISIYDDVMALSDDSSCKE